MEASRGQRAQRGGPAATVQPEVSDQVDEAWLRDFDSERSEYLRRLETDRSIIAELRAAGFAGRDYDYFASEIAKYGIAVMAAWIRTHQIFSKLRSRGRGLAEPSDDVLRDTETAFEVAMETVAYALGNFRTYVLLPGRWDPDRGASIRTYFIGQCLIQFPNVYRRWHRETFDRAPWPELANEAMLTARGYEHVEQQVQQQRQVGELLTAVKKDRTREVLVLRGAGWTQEQISERLEMTLKTVEMIVANERKRQQRGRAG